MQCSLNRRWCIYKCTRVCNLEASPPPLLDHYMYVVREPVGWHTCGLPSLWKGMVSKALVTSVSTAGVIVTIPIVSPYKCTFLNLSCVRGYVHNICTHNVHVVWLNQSLLCMYVVRCTVQFESHAHLYNYNLTTVENPVAQTLDPPVLN